MTANEQGDNESGTTTMERETVATRLPLADPAELGFSRARLARIGSVLQTFIDAGEMPGCVAYIALRRLYLRVGNRTHHTAPA